MKTRLFLLFPLLWQPVSASTQTLLFDPIDEDRDRTVPIRAYIPESKGTHPVILFSHGLGGSRDNNPYLGNHWAENGYVSIFLQHPGTDETVWKSVKPGERFQALKNAVGIPQSIDRFLDVPFILNQLEKWNGDKAHTLAGKLDLEKVGLCGHSFGAVTAQALAGQKYYIPGSFHDQRIDAFLPMSPQPFKSLPPEPSFGHIQAPILCMTGTKDGSPIDPAFQPEHRRKVYDALPATDKFQLILDGGNHYAFSDNKRALIKKVHRDPKHHPAIQKVSTRFWDAYLKGDTEAKAWLQSKSVPQDSGLGEGDSWEWK